MPQLLPCPRRLSTAWVFVGSLMLVGLMAFAGVTISDAGSAATHS